MKYQSDMDTSPLVLDIETDAHPDAALYLEPVQAAKNLKDPAKIEIDIIERTKARDEKIGLDWNVGRIVCLGYWTEATGVKAWTVRDEDAEATVLDTFWKFARHRTLCGFGIKMFDLRFMTQRSRLLGVDHPVLDLGKYTRRGITDLYSMLTFDDGHFDAGAMRRTLTMFCRRFGIDVPEDISGKDVPALIAAGEWDAVEAHCRQDVQLTVALARKLGVVQPELVAKERAVGVLET